MVNYKGKFQALLFMFRSAGYLVSLHSAPHASNIRIWLDIKEYFSHYLDGQILEYGGQTHCGTFILGNIQNSNGQYSKQPDLSRPVSIWAWTVSFTDASF